MIEEYKIHKLQILQWCTYDTDFRPNTIDKGFKLWIWKGVRTIYSLTENGQFKNFEGLKEDYDLDRADFYRFLQVRNRFESNIRKEMDLTDPILVIFIEAYQSKSNKEVFSKIYKAY